VLKLAAKMLRHRLGSTIATLIALAVGVLILTPWAARSSRACVTTPARAGTPPPTSCSRTAL